MLPVLFLGILLTAASVIAEETSFSSVQASTDETRGLPVVGDVWGPVITHAGRMKFDTQHRYRHRYYYPSSTGKQDILVDYILPSDIFWNKKDMYGHIKAAVTGEDVVVELDPAALEGKYLEIVSSKVIPANAVKMVCHSYKTKPFFCHKLAATQHKFKLMYSMVRDVDNGILFPAVFASHQGCAGEKDQPECYWVTHVNEILILDKRVV